MSRTNSRLTFSSHARTDPKAINDDFDVVEFLSGELPDLVVVLDASEVRLLEGLPSQHSDHFHAVPVPRLPDDAVDAARSFANVLAENIVHKAQQWRY